MPIIPGRYIRVWSRNVLAKLMAWPGSGLVTLILITRVPETLVTLSMDRSSSTDRSVPVASMTFWTIMRLLIM